MEKENLEKKKSYIGYLMDNILIEMISLKRIYLNPKILYEGLAPLKT